MEERAQDDTATLLTPDSLVIWCPPLGNKSPRSRDRQDLSLQRSPLLREDERTSLGLGDVTGQRTGLNTQHQQLGGDRRGTFLAEGAAQAKA